MTVGIVLVSHSAALAEAARQVALQMAGPNPPPIAVAAGMPDGGLGTDAAAVAQAITAVASADGVLVLMDLGSAVLSAQMAVELADLPGVPVELCAGPFVEGLVAAVVRAAGGSSLPEVAAEARRGLVAKQAQLGEEPEPDTHPVEAAVGEATGTGSEQSDIGTSPPTVDRGSEPLEVFRDVQVVNAIGLHARPAATLARLAAELASPSMVSDLTRQTGPVRADSALLLMSLGAVKGDTVRVSATGPQARAAVEALADLIARGIVEP